MKDIKLKINIPMVGFKSGDYVSVKADKHGTPLEKFWRRRLRDSFKDKCVEVISEETKAEESKINRKQEQIK